MARTMGMEVLEQKIEKAQMRVSKTKAAYDRAIDELQNLLDKKMGLQADVLVKAMAESDKSFDEILNFIVADKNEED